MADFCHWRCCSSPFFSFFNFAAQQHQLQSSTPIGRQASLSYGVGKWCDASSFAIVITTTITAHSAKGFFISTHSTQSTHTRLFSPLSNFLNRKSTDAEKAENFVAAVLGRCSSSSSSSAASGTEHRLGGFHGFICANFCPTFSLLLQTSHSSSFSPVAAYVLDISFAQFGLPFAPRFFCFLPIFLFSGCIFLLLSSSYFSSSSFLFSFLFLFCSLIFCPPLLLRSPSPTLLQPAIFSSSLLPFYPPTIDFVIKQPNLFARLFVCQAAFFLLLLDCIMCYISAGQKTPFSASTQL